MDFSHVFLIRSLAYEQLLILSKDRPVQETVQEMERWQKRYY
jgi:hypothetical protein